MMSSIAQVESNAAASAYEAAGRADAAQKADGKTKVKGMTIGEPKLSEKAQKYYEQLKKKYGDMDFILVSSDMKEQAKAQAGNYANANRTVVLIDEEKIERMAEDENYQKQYEGIISNARGQISQMLKSLKGNSNVKTVGMQVNDGGNASFFAVVDKSMKAQKERIKQKAADKKEAAKAEEKKAKAKKAEERKAAKAEEKKKADKADWGETETITASSIEELIQKINDYTYASMSDYAQTEEEKLLGQHVDFRW